MPFKYQPPQGPPTPPPDESGSVSGSDLARLAVATGLRVAGPWVGGIGGGLAAAALAPETGGGSALAGPSMVAGGSALGGGAGEWLAEKIEPRFDKKREGFFNKDISPGRIAVATGLGAVPGSWIVRGGKPFLSAGAGATLGYAGVAGNKIAEGQKVTDAINPTNWSGSELIGGPVLGALTGGVLSKIHGGGGAAPPEAPKGPILNGETAQIKTGPDGNKIYTVPEGANVKNGKVTYNPTTTPKTPKQPTTMQKAVTEADTISAANKEYNARVAPLIRKSTAATKEGLTQATTNTVPSGTSTTQPTGVGSVVQGDVPGSRFAVADPEGAEGVLPIQPDTIVASEKPEAPSEATQAALGKPANKRILQTQVQQERSAANQAANRENAADLQDTRTTEGGTNVPAINKANAKEAAAVEKAQDEAAQQSNIDEFLANPENKPTVGPVKIVTKGTSGIGEPQSQVTTVGPEDLNEGGGEDEGEGEVGPDPHGMAFPNPKAAKAAVKDFGGSARTHDVTFDPNTKQWMVTNKGLDRPKAFDAPALDISHSPIAEAAKIQAAKAAKAAATAPKAPPTPPVEPPPAAAPVPTPPMQPQGGAPAAATMGPESIADQQARIDASAARRSPTEVPRPTTPGGRVTDFSQPAQSVPEGLEGVVSNNPPAPAAPAPVTPKATFLGYSDPRMSPDGVSQPMYNIEGGASDKSTVTGEAGLAKAGVTEKPETPSFKDWSDNRAAKEATNKIVEATAAKAATPPPAQDAQNPTGAVGQVTTEAPTTPSKVKSKGTVKAQTTDQAAQTVTNQIEKVVDTQGAASAKDIHTRVMTTLQKALEDANANGTVELHKATAASPGTITLNGTPLATVDRYGTFKWDYNAHETLGVPKESLPDPGSIPDSSKLTPSEFQRAAVNRMSASASQAKGSGRLQVKVPGDGTFTVENNPNAIGVLMGKVKSAGPKIFGDVVGQGEPGAVPREAVTPTQQSAQDIHLQNAKLFAQSRGQKVTPQLVAKIAKENDPTVLQDLLRKAGVRPAGSNFDPNATVPENPPTPAKTAAPPTAPEPTGKPPLGPPRLVKKGNTTPEPPPVAEAAPEEPAAPEQSKGAKAVAQLNEASKNYGAMKDAKAAGDQGFEPARTYYGQKAGGATGRAVAAEPTPEEIESGLADNPQAKEALIKALKKKGLSEMKRNPESGAIDPMVLYRLGGGLAGAGIGAAADKEDRLKGALVGGAIGALGPDAIRLGANAAGKIDPSEIVKRLPDIQRFNYLSDPWGLAANTVGAPTGLGTTTAIEKMLQGVYSGDRALVDQGKSLLGGLRTIPGKMAASFREAENVLPNSPMNVGESLPLARAKTPFDRGISAPATAITAAHMALRDVGIEAGLPEAEATEMALGNEPGTGSGNQNLRALGQAWQNFKATPATDEAGNITAKNVIGNLIAPFTRTASNVLAATPSRAPGVGLLAKAMGQEIAPSELAAQQTMGVGISAGAYELGKHTDPAVARYLRKWVRNLGGRYGLIASAAFEAGQAARTGQSALAAVGKGAIEGAPMPTMEAPKDWYEAVTAPFTEGKFKVPRSAIPAVFQKEATHPLGIVPPDLMTGGGFRYKPKQ